MKTSPRCLLFGTRKDRKGVFSSSFHLSDNRKSITIFSPDFCQVPYQVAYQRLYKKLFSHIPFFVVLEKQKPIGKAYREKGQNCDC